MLAFNIQATLLLKALSYDAEISRFSEIRTAVLYSGREDEDVADGFLEAFGTLKKKEVAGISVTAAKVKSGSDISGYQLIYIASSNPEFVKKVVASAGKSITATPYPNMVKNGVVLGFGEVEGKPKIFVNLKASKSAGCKFSSDFLRLAEVVE
jgi:hypothetical protein